MSEYVAMVRWSRDEQDFALNKYSRAHNWEFDGGVVVPASASPHHVPPPQSVEANVDPEEALVAAASSCHMLSFLAIAAKQRFVVDTYVDRAVGTMEEIEKDKYAISRVTLRPKVSFSGARLPTVEELERLHHSAHEYCFIANSLKAEITTEIVLAEDPSSPV